MSLSDVGEIVVVLLACISIPSIFAISKGNKGESFADSKLPIIWPILVAAAYTFYLHSINSYSGIPTFIGAALIFVLVTCGVYGLIDKRYKEKAFIKEEMERKERELRNLRDELSELQDKGNDHL